MINDKSTNLSDELLSQKIYFLRGLRIMLDRDIAELYGIKAIRLREQVKRNITKFPPNFMFQLTEKEVDYMVSQFAIPSNQHLGGSLPYAFTEHGVLMLANVIKSEIAIKMSIRIIEVFVKMRELLISNKEILLQLEKLEREVEKNSSDIGVLFSAIRQILNPPSLPRKKIGFNT